MWKIFIFCYTPFCIHLYVYFVICLIVYFYINNIFIEISCFVVPFIDNLICFWLTTGIKRWIRKCRQSVNYWNPTKVKSWCGADTEMQGDSTSDQYGCLVCSRHRSDIEPCCTSDIGPTLQCRHSVAYWCRTEVKSRCRADMEMQGGSTSDRYGCLICSRHRSNIEPCCTSDVGPTWKPMSARCRKVYRPDIGPI